VVHPLFPFAAAFFPYDFGFSFLPGAPQPQSLYGMPSVESLSFPNNPFFFDASS